MADGNSIQEKMKQYEIQSKDKDLNAILRSTETQTQQELVAASARTDTLKDYMEVNATLAKQINEFLEKNQTYKDKFNAMLKSPKASTVGRFMRATPILKAFGKADYFNPQNVAQVINDMYTNMILQKGAVQKQLDVILVRRDGLVKDAEGATMDLEKAANLFEKLDNDYKLITPIKQTLDKLIEQQGKPMELDLNVIKEYYTTLGITDATKVERVNLVSLQKVSQDVDNLYLKVEESRTKAEIEMNSANSAIPAFKLLQSQFNAYVKSTKVLLYGLETHLKYSKTIVESQAILSQGIDVAIKATKAFSEYQNAIDQTFVLNALGVKVMYEQTAELLSRDSFDPASIEKGKQIVAEGNAYWDTFQQKYDQKGLELLQKLREAQQPTIN